MVYLDNAATTGKKPMSVIKAVNSTLLELSANPGRGGHKSSVRASEAIYGVRQKVAKLFGASGEDRVVFTPSCTASINIVLKGILDRGDGIVISSLEHNSVTRPCETLRKSGVEVSVAEVIFGDNDATVRSFERAIKSNTKAVLCTHASNVTGEIMPIAKIGALCKQKGILFIVDAAQTAGVIPIDMQGMGIDFLCIAPHKGLYAPMGTGILIAEKEITHPLIEGGTGVNSAVAVQPLEYPERLESGTVNLPGIIGIGAGVDFVNSKGIENIYKAELDISRYIYNGILKTSGCVLYTPIPEYGKFVPVVSFNIRGISASDTSELLDKADIAVRGGLHCAPFAHKRLGTIEGGTVRVSPAIFNTKRDADIFLFALKRISFNYKNSKKH
ncbi:MAG: aminotransferase class V-fold PLP-dependent enzyme [Clostridia bacterium]|nr:aminotransferase class V-fold PLP-dependent enzyme [Clostridia bacterium]